MKKTVIPAVLAAICLVVSGCSLAYEDPYYNTRHYLMQVCNGTDKAIVWFVPEHGDVDCEECGALPETLSDYLKSHFYRLEPYASRDVIVYENGDLSPIEQYHPDDLVPFYFFDAQVLADTDWKKIVDEHLWLAHHRISVEDLLKNKQTITYPSKVFTAVE